MVATKTLEERVKEIEDALVYLGQHKHCIDELYTRLRKLEAWKTEVLERFPDLVSN
jgi:hypothetical protein